MCTTQQLTLAIPPNHSATAPESASLRGEDHGHTMRRDLIGELRCKHAQIFVRPQVADVHRLARVEANGGKGGCDVCRCGVIGVEENSSYSTLRPASGHKFFRPNLSDSESAKGISGGGKRLLLAG